MNSMKKIIVFGMTENPGGVESFLMNYYRKMNHNNVHLDFLCNSYNKIAYEDELISYGSKTFHFTPRRENPVVFHRELNDFFQKHAKEYDAIWVNVSSLANIDYLKLAKKYDIPKRIIHSHNSRNMDGRLRGLLHEHNRKIIDKYATDFWACSQDAAKWFYRDDLMSKVKIIHNAIDVSKYQFDPEKRKNIRKQLGIDENSYVMGNVGRLHFQKNQIFALDIVAALKKKKSDVYLILVGQGEDETKLREKCSKLGIEKQVIFAGMQKDIPGWLSTFDLFLFPSLFEGLSIAALEAQADGLPVLASNKVIPEELKINDNFQFFSLDQSAEEWADQIYGNLQYQKRADEAHIVKQFKEKGYLIDEEAPRLEKMLMED